MAAWITVPSEPLKFHPYQAAFWAALKERICTQCHQTFSVPPHLTCPACQGEGLRKFNRFALISGRRGGKTRGGAVAVVEQLTIPNSVWWAACPSNPKLMRYTLPALQALIPEGWVKSWSAEYLDLRLKNGSWLHLQTLESPDQGRGQGLDGVWIDETSELTEEHWHVLRPSLTDRRGVAIITTTPRGSDWVYDRFYAPAMNGVPGYWACHYATAENPIISPDEIAEAKASMPYLMYMREYEASFANFQGAIYEGMVLPQILRTPAELQRLIPEWPDLASWRQILVGIDTGAEHPFGAVKLVATEQGLVVIGEYLERNKSFLQHATALKRLADSSSAKWAINKNEKQQSLELAQHGIYCQKAENEQMAGIERVKTWLHAKQLWFYEPLCPQTVVQMNAYRWADSEARDGQLRRERVYKLNDELPDCIRYAMMTWPTLPKTPPVVKSHSRDLSQLTPSMQAVIERMRKIEGIPEEPESVTGDFYA